MPAIGKNYSTKPENSPSAHITQLRLLSLNQTPNRTNHLLILRLLLILERLKLLSIRYLSFAAETLRIKATT